MSKKVLILGGAGFIGINLCLILKNSGYNVTVVDTLDNSFIFSEKLFEKHDIKFIKHSILDPSFMIESVKNKDYVVNLTSSNVIDDGFFFQESLAQTSILGSQMLFQSASHATVKKIIIASNMHVYGEPKPFRSKCKESSSSNPCNPLGSIKLSEEIISKTLAKAYDQKIAIVRISECYGAYMKTHMPYSAMMSMIISSLTNTNYISPNDGEDSRDWVFVEDVCCYIKSILEDDSQKELIETYNICSGETKTFKEVYQHICNVCGNKENKLSEKLVIYPFVGHLFGDNTKLIKKFGKNFNSFQDKVELTIDWTKKNLENQQNLFRES